MGDVVDLSGNVLDAAPAAFDDGGGGGGGMEARISRIETELAELKGKVAQLPTTWQMTTWGIGIAVTVILAVGGSYLALSSQMGSLYAQLGDVKEVMGIIQGTLTATK